MSSPKHVYCTDCIRGDALWEALSAKGFPNLIPERCVSCYPFDPEDSRGDDLRVNYEAKPEAPDDPST